MGLLKWLIQLLFGGKVYDAIKTAKKFAHSNSVDANRLLADELERRRKERSEKNS